MNESHPNKSYQNNRDIIKEMIQTLDTVLCQSSARSLSPLKGSGLSISRIASEMMVGG
jgi:hypothetical protein